MSLSPTEIKALADQALAERAARLARTRPPRSKSPSRATRRKLSEASRRHAARTALADPHLPPVKRARIERGWSLARASAMAGISLNSWWAVEQADRAGSVSRKTWKQISRALGLPLDQIRPF